MYQFGSFDAPFTRTKGGAGFDDEEAVQIAVNHHFREARHFHHRAMQASESAAKFFRTECRFHQERAEELYDLFNNGKTLNEVAFNRFLLQHDREGYKKTLTPIQPEEENHGTYARDLVEYVIEQEEEARA